MLWPWAVAVVPALALLAMMMPLRMPLPYNDGWVYVQQYQDWFEGRCDWRQLFVAHDFHPSAVGKAIYFIVLHWLHGEVRLLPLLSWSFSAVIAACVCFLSRPLWTGKPLRGAALMFCANLTIFSAAQGETWIWEFVFQNYIPGACFAAGLVLLSTSKPGKWRVIVAALLNVIAIFSFSSGFLAGLLLSMPLWHGMKNRSTSKKLLVTGTWIAFTCLTTWIAHNAFGSQIAPVSISILADRPMMRLQFVLILLGQMLGKGTMFDPEMLCAVAGAAFTIVFFACMAFVFHRRHDREVVSASLPWVACCFYGMANAVLISFGRMTHFVNRALLPRYATFTLFFVFGTLFLVAVVLRHNDATFAPTRWVKKLAGPALAVFLVVNVWNWGAGWQAMNLYSRRNAQDCALLEFAPIIPPDPDRLYNDRNGNSTYKLAKFLVEHDRLRCVKFVTDNRVESLRRSGRISEKWAHFDNPVLLDDGRWKLGGTCGLSKDLSLLTDLVVVTAESAAGDGERIVASAAPLLPDDFFDGNARKHDYLEHYFGWTKTLGASSLPKGAITLRAYAYEHDTRCLRPMDGLYKVESAPR